MGRFRERNRVFRMKPLSVIRPSAELELLMNLRELPVLSHVDMAKIYKIMAMPSIPFCVIVWESGGH